MSFTVVNGIFTTKFESTELGCSDSFGGDCVDASEGITPSTTVSSPSLSSGTRTPPRRSSRTAHNSPNESLRMFLLAYETQKNDGESKCTSQNLLQRNKLRINSVQKAPSIHDRDGGLRARSGASMHSHSASPAVTPQNIEKVKSGIDFAQEKTEGRCNRFVRVVGTMYVTVLLLGTVTIAYVSQVLFSFVFYPWTTPESRHRRCASILQKMAILGGITLNPLWRVETVRPLVFPTANATNKNNKDSSDSTREILKRKKVIFFCNHLSNADVWITASADSCIIPSDTAFVGKASIFSVPIGGWAVANSGHLKVQFTSEKNGWGVKKGTTGTLLSCAKDYLNARRSLVLYPEGARNPNPEGPVKEFKLGFFSLCAEMADDYYNNYSGKNKLDRGLEESYALPKEDRNANLSTPTGKKSVIEHAEEFDCDDDLITIVPVAISGVEKLWPLKSILLGAGTAYVSFGEPTNPKRGETAEQLRDRVHSTIEHLRDNHPDRQHLSSPVLTE